MSTAVHSHIPLEKSPSHLDVAHRAREHARERRLLVCALFVADIAALIVALAVAGFVRLVIDSVLPLATLGWTDRHIFVSVVAVPILIGVFWMQGRYEIDNCFAGTHDYAHIAHGVTYGVIVALALSYFSGGEPLISRSWLLLVWALSIICLGLGRFIARRLVRRLRRGGLLRTRVAIVGASTLSVALAEQLLASEGEGIDVIGFLDEYLPLGQPLLRDISVIGRPGDLTRRQTDAVDEYIFVPEALPHERLEEITRLMIAREGPVFRMAVSSRDLLTHGVLVTQRGNVPLVTLRRARIRGMDLVLKRGLDTIGALLALAIVGPFTLAALARAYLAGIRPLLVPQVIHTPGGGQTRVWLLAHGVSGRLAVRGAPALLAVLFGELSLVGPRPVAHQPTEGVPRGLWATAVSPGVTGPWRLSGPQSSIEDQMIQDLAYVRNYSIWEDLRILWRSARPGALLGRWQAPTDPELSESEQITNRSHSVTSA